MANLAQRLRARGFVIGDHEEQLLQVLRGQSVVTKFDGSGKQTERIVTVRHKDAAVGLMLGSALGLNDFGLAPSSIETKAPDATMYRRFAPTADPRVIAYKDSLVAEQLTPAEIMTMALLSADHDADR